MRGTKKHLCKENDPVN